MELLVGVGVFVSITSRLYVTTPPISWGRAIVIALTSAQLSALLMVSSALIVGVLLKLASRALGSVRLNRAADAAGLAVPPFTIVVPMLLLGVNVILLRYRYSPISILTDTAIVLASAFVFVMVVRWLSTKELDFVTAVGSRPWALGGLLLVLSSGWLSLSDPKSQLLKARLDSENMISVPSSQGAEAGHSEVPLSTLNLIVISIDTLRSDHLGSYGYGRPVSPNLDVFAEEGIRFSQAYSTSPWTLPSHHSLITGQYPSRHGADTSPVFTKEVDRLPENRITLAEVLKDAGYSTAAFTSADLLGSPFGFDQGFDVIDHRGRGEGLAGRWALGRKWIESEGTKPFFLFLHCFDVHGYQSPEPFRKRFVRPYSGRLRSLYDDRRRFMRMVVSNGFYSLGESDIDFLVDLYDAAIAYVDETFVGIRSNLEEQGLWENSVVVVLSDHGEEFWDHGGTGHGFTFYEEQLRIPILLKIPGGPTNLVVDSRVRLVDLMPTILEVLGLPIPTGVQGQTLMPVIEGREKADRPVFAEASHVGNSAALIFGDHKLVGKSTCRATYSVSIG